MDVREGEGFPAFLPAGARLRVWTGDSGFMECVIVEQDKKLGPPGWTLSYRQATDEELDERLL